MNKVTMKGNELPLSGSFPTTNSKLPNFKLHANDLQVKTHKNYEGKTLVILTVPSLDTGVCDMEVRKFNKEAAGLSKDVQVLAVSADLPFAQGRWCAAAGIDNVETLSDYFDASFGKSMGVLIEPLRLLARAVFVYNKKGELEYSELVSEVTNEPDYAKALEAAKKAL